MHQLQSYINYSLYRSLCHGLKQTWPLISFTSPFNFIGKKSWQCITEAGCDTKGDPPANLMAQYITLNEVAILSLFGCLGPVIYSGIVVLCPLFISALTKWMKQLSSLSARVVEM